MLGKLDGYSRGGGGWGVLNAEKAMRYMAKPPTKRIG